MKTNSVKIRRTRLGRGRAQVATVRNAPRFSTAIQRTLPVKRILVPVDFSAGSKKAIACATGLARRHGASVSLVHVVEPILFRADYGYGPVARQIADAPAIKRAQARLDRLGAARTGQCLVRSGIAFFEIVEAARRMNSDLIVIGARGSAGCAKPHLGGTAEKVVRHAPCPVLVVHGKEPQCVL